MYGGHSKHAVLRRRKKAEQVQEKPEKKTPVFSPNVPPYTEHGIYGLGYTREPTRVPANGLHTTAGQWFCPSINRTL